MTRKISIYGSTGSIGTQTIDVLNGLSGFEVVALACNSNEKLMLQQIKELEPRFAAIIDGKKADSLKREVAKLGISTEVVGGRGEAMRVCTGKEVDTMVNATVGISGLMPTLEAIKRSKDVALANKETLVTGGELVMRQAKLHNVSVLPVDSEHSAIWQCLQGNRGNKIEKILLTCSGGPFRGKKTAELTGVTKESALNHPTWKMGGKITIDSATLFNKGLEIMEASTLFGIEEKDVEVVLHPQSIIHSMVQFCDGSIMAQLGTHDMRTPIQYALTYPHRIRNEFPRLDLFGVGHLDMEKPDTKTFRSLDLAREAIRRRGLYPAVLNGANEKAVELFLNGEISFLNIFDFVERSLNDYRGVMEVSLPAILEADRWSREHVTGLARKGVHIGETGKRERGRGRFSVSV